METFIAILLETVRNEFKKPAPSWQQVSLEPTDLQFLNKECNQSSEFDPTNKRQTMYQNLVKGKAPVVIARCPYGQVTVVLENPGQRGDIPWALWARILRLYSEKIGNTAPFKVFFLASTSLRQFPSGTKPITPENINGGYTYHCNMETIFIYRAEDATRVLIHELQHASCLDHMEQGVDLVEAETEAWAELLYAGLLSQGGKPLFHELVKKQADWMEAQNAVVKRHIHHERQFPWRYTVGKEEVWERWGLLQKNKNILHSRASPHTLRHPMHSLRLTPPPSAALKRDFGASSNIL